MKTIEITDEQYALLQMQAGNQIIGPAMPVDVLVDQVVSLGSMAVSIDLSDDEMILLFVKAISQTQRALYGCTISSAAAALREMEAKRSGQATAKKEEPPAPAEPENK